MRKSKKLHLATYNCNVVITTTDDLRGEVNAIYKKLKSKEVFDSEAEGILLTLDIDNYYVIFDIEYLSHNTIAHELYHTVVKVTEDRDIVDEESQAWLMGYLTQETYKYISKNDFKLTK
jgi:hypothetical protein